MPPYPRFLGGSYVAQSPISAQELTVNLYPEQKAPGTAYQGAQHDLYPTPGVDAFATSAGSQGRASFSQDGRMFVVISATLWEVSSDGTLTNRGTVAVDGNPATICTNGDGGGQLFITSGDNGYLLDLTSNVFSTVRTGATTMGIAIDGYFGALDAATSTLFLSDLLDGTTWDPTQFAQRSIQSDPWVSVIVLDRYVWLLGTQTSEIWYNAGTFPFPFAPHPSGLVDYGTAASFSPAVVAGTLVWLAQTADGTGQVVSASGFSPQVISTPALDVALAGYAMLSDAVGDTYQDLGHTFYILTLPGANATHVYDTTTQLWHNRGTWLAESMRYDAWRPLHHAFCFGKHLMLDRASGLIYRLSSTSGVDVESRPIRRLRRAPLLVSEKRVFIAAFELLLEWGLGLASGQGSNPQVSLRISTDGGKTWGSEHWRSAGARGAYGTRVRWSRCGGGARLVYEIAMTDPIPWRLTGATLVPRARAA